MDTDEFTKNEQLDGFELCLTYLFPLFRALSRQLLLLPPPPPPPPGLVIATTGLTYLYSLFYYGQIIVTAAIAHYNAISIAMHNNIIIAAYKCTRKCRMHVLNLAFPYCNYTSEAHVL